MQGAPNMNEIMKIAKQVASSIEKPSGDGGEFDPNTFDMNKVFQQVSKMVTPELIGQISGGGSGGGKKVSNKGDKMKKIANGTDPLPVADSKISLNNDSPPEKKQEKKPKKERSRIEELSSDSECDPISPRTKDMMFTMEVSLEDLYNGKRKKLAIRRQTLDDGEQKKKISVIIERGMLDEQHIRFNKLADEKQGYETGDVVVILSLVDNETFERDGNNLIIEKEISLSESYNPCVYITHLDGRVLKVTGERMDIFGEDFDTFKKVSGQGMPVPGQPGMFGDLFIRFKCVVPSSFTPEQMISLTELFPKLNVPIECETIHEKELELVTETDMEFLGESDSEYSDSDYSDSDYSDSESGTESESDDVKSVD